jgi:hypothetical protein
MTCNISLIKAMGLLIIFGNFICNCASLFFKCIAPGCDSSGKTNVENGLVKIELQGSKLSVICFEDFETHQFPVIVCNQIAYNASLPLCYREYTK